MLTDRRAATRSHGQPRLGGAFHLLWLGQAVSQLGDYLPYIALPLFVKYLIDGTFGLAAVYSLETLPAVVVGLFGGYLIDRMRLRRTMIFTDLVRAGAFGYLAVLAASNPAEGSGRGLASVFVVALVAGTFASFFNGALYSAVPRVVPPERLTDANGRLASTQGLANVVGPALAGLLVASVGFWPTFAINAATFLVSAITLAFVPGIDGRASDGGDPETPSRMLDGMRHLWTEPRIRLATLGTAGAHLVLGFFEATLVLIAEDIGA
ncbi:MAG: MFS transporter, partial [Acidimicrobiia bacterium]|nr:MFS transporter [Acidimicrobiia bacterium]